MLLIGNAALALALTVSAYVGLTLHALAVIARIAGSMCYLSHAQSPRR